MMTNFNPKKKRNKFFVDNYILPILFFVSMCLITSFSRPYYSYKCTEDFGKIKKMIKQTIVSSIRNDLNLTKTSLDAVKRGSRNCPGLR